MRKKLWASYTVMLVLAMLLGYGWRSSVASMRHEAEQGLGQSAQALELVGGLNTSLANMRFAQRGVVLFSMAKEEKDVTAQTKRLETEAANVRQLCTKLEAVLDSDADRADLAKFREASERYIEFSSQTVANSKSGDYAGAIDVLRTKSRPFGTAMETIAAKLADSQHKRGAAATAGMDQLAARASLVQWIVLGLFAACGVGLFFVLRRAMAALTSVAHNVASGADQISMATRQITELSQVLARSASTQVESLTNASDAATAIAKATDASTAKSHAAAEGVAHLQSLTSTGRDTTNELANAMSEVKTSSENVSRIIKSMDEIAFQTNLLSLNASVEAARAGEAGVGFAVVADEVRALADRSKNAAQDSVQLVGSSISSAGRGAHAAHGFTAWFQEVEGEFGRISQSVEEIAENGREQNRDVHHIQDVVVRLNKMAQDLASEAEETAAASEELAAQSEGLRDLSNELTAVLG